ncbi:hypothetical protein Hdeb2414_s0003g00107771 [Helianthus debilis subsp. tardiflorus]
MSHRLISDTDSELDEFHSSLHADSPFRSGDIISSTSTSTAIVTIDKFRSRIRSPLSGTTSSPPPPLPPPSSPIRPPLSVMVSDKTQGWNGDSFDRYIEFKYVLFNFVANCVI